MRDTSENLAFDQYVSGLHSAGYRYDPRLVRRGYVMGSALRWGVAGMFWLHQALEEAQMTGDTQGQERSQVEGIEYLTAIIAFTLRILAEARDLLSKRRR